MKVLAQDDSGLTSNWTTLSLTCAGSATAGLNENNNIGGGTLDAVLNLRVIPSLVRNGNTTQVNWSATNVQSCTVTAPSGDAWDTVLSIIGGQTSRPITEETTYTLSCIDSAGATLTKTATVRILPKFREK